MSAEEAAHLEAQGLAHRATKTTRQADVETSNQSSDEVAPESEPVEVGTDIKREELDAVATHLGMENLEQYSTKAELVEAIEAKRS